MSSTPLEQRIIERIQQHGPITFAEYMRMALYDPEYGYYVTGSAKMGWEGDYFTSTDLPAFFAHCLARQLIQWWKKLGQPTPFVVVEQGAGRGQLAQEIATWARNNEPTFYTALNYHTEDIRTGQDANAPSLSLEPSVIFSNELIDAFPVHIVETRQQHLYEVYIDVSQGHLYEVLSEPGTAEVASYLDTYRIPWSSFEDGWRAEINLDALRWVQRTASIIQRGYILTIDYGDKARELYTRERQHGTLACYFQHRLNQRPLAQPGKQDITAHVNFSALIHEGRRQGFHLHTFTSQRLWLEELGIKNEFEQLRQNEFAAAETERATDRGQIALLQLRNLHQQIATLTDPAGMGNFKVLILRR